MKKRVLGLSCFWLVIMVVISMLPLSAIAAETKDVYLIKDVDIENTDFDYIGDHMASHSITLNTPLNEQSELMEKIKKSSPEGYVLSGWRLWSAIEESGGIYLGSGAIPNNLPSDAEITEGLLPTIDYYAPALEPIMVLKYKIDTQPTDTDPTVKVSQSDDGGESWFDITERNYVTYQWHEHITTTYTVIEGTPAENQIAVTTTYNEPVFSAEGLWSAGPSGEIDIVFPIEKGDKIRVTPIASEGTEATATVSEYDTEFVYELEDGAYVWEATRTQNDYNLYIVGFEEGVSFKINVVRAGVGDAVAGQTDNTLTSSVSGTYACVVSAGGESTLTSNPVNYVAPPPVEPPAVYTVSFESNGGSAVAQLKVAGGSKPEKPADPTRSGYSFLGWYKDKALTEKYDFGSAVTSDITIYAAWEEIPVSEDDSGGAVIWIVASAVAVGGASAAGVVFYLRKRRKL